MKHILPLFPFSLCRIPAGLMAAFVVAISIQISVSAQETFDERAQFLLESLRSEPVPSPGGSGKLPYGRTIAYLEESGGTNADALEYLAGTGYGGEIFFNSIMQVRGLYMAEDHLSESQKSSILAQASDSGNNWGNLGTENHRLMTWSSGYLLAQFFPDAQWNWRGETIDSQTLMERTKEALISVGRNEYSAGYSEFLSPTYELFHVAPMINLYDYADDPEVKAIAEAFLIHHFSLLALGSFEEVILPPWSRRSPDMESSMGGAISQWLLWLFWGHGKVNSAADVDPTMPLVFFAVSAWRPPEILDQIAKREIEFPYTLRTQQTHWQWNPTRYVMRTTYHEPSYALSSGVVRHLPSAFQLDDAQFMIAWTGGAPIRQITAYHPYWRTDTEDVNDFTAPTSPFMQTGHHENTAIMLFDIPAEDPWAGVGQWAGERAGDVIPLAQLRFPSHMSYAADAENDWVFLADGAVYIAIKVLQDGWTRDRRTLSGFNMIRSRGTVGQPWRTGFIFEVGTEEEFGTFADFQGAILANPLTVDLGAMTVSYTNARGDVLNFEYNTSLEDIPNHTVPTLFSVNGLEVNYDENWPVMESPWSSLEDRLLVLENPDQTYTVSNWKESVPVVTQATDEPVPPSFLTQPADLTTDEGETVVLSASVAGSDPLTYQWFKDGDPILGATDISLTLTDVVEADSGAYTLEVRNDFGFELSEAALVTVNTVAPTGLTVGDWNLTDVGFVYGYTTEWGYSTFMGFVYMANYPWIYQVPFGYLLMASSAPVDGGGTTYWLHSPDPALDWIFVNDNNGGFFQYSASNYNWDNFLTPNP